MDVLTHVLSKQKRWSKITVGQEEILFWEWYITNQINLMVLNPPGETNKLADHLMPENLQFAHICINDPF